MKKLKTFSLLILLLISSVNLFSQTSTGAVCGLALSINNLGLTSSVNQPSADGWLQFVATNTSENITIKNIIDGTTTGKIIKATVYSGSCVNLNFTVSDSISNSSDSTLILIASNLIVGNTYYLNTTKGVFPSQCTSGACGDNAKIDVVVALNMCGFSWSFYPPTFLQPDQTFDADYNFVSGGACMTNPPANNQAFFSQCSINTCTPTLYLGYSIAGANIGNNMIPSYVLYVFTPNPALNYSVSINNFTATINFTAFGTYTIASADVNGAPCFPPVSSTLQPSDLCSCKNLVVNYLGTPNCNFSITPTPLCEGQPFCFFNLSSNPLQFYNNATTIGVLHPPSPGTLFPTGCVPNGLAAGNYTLKAELHILDNNFNDIPGCFCFKETPITVNKVPPIPDLTASPAAGCSGQTVSLGASSLGASGFTWVPGNFSGSPITTTINGTTIYTVTAGNGSGCTSSNTIVVIDQNCCKNPNAGAIYLKNITIVPYNLNNVIPWSTLIPGGTYANITIGAPGNGFIAGNYTIDGFLNVNASGIIFKGANVYFTEASIINQNQPMTIEYSYFHGCNFMWNGIRSSNSLTIIGSIFEDAVNAVYLLGSIHPPFVTTHPGLIIQNSVFNINYTAVNVTGLKFMEQAHNPIFTCSGNIFTSKILPASIYATFNNFNNIYVNILAPNLNSYPASNIKGSTLMNIPSNVTAVDGIKMLNIPNAHQIRIGDITPGNSPNNNLLTNYFNLLQRGIEVTNAPTFIFNGIFDNIVGSSTGVAGIYHSGGNTKIGNQTPLAFNKFRCTFNNSSAGIYATGGGTLNADYNIFNLNSVGNHIEFYNTPSSLLSITNNTLTECTIDFNSFSNSINARITFDQNTATATFFSNKKRYHVFINELSTISSPTYVVTNNTLSGKDVGVFMQNVNNSNVVANIITTNLVNTIFGVNNGVELNNVISTWINDNTITCATPNINLNLVITGINSNLTMNNTYACNTIYNTGVCLKYSGSSPSNIYKNLLNVNPGSPNKYGIWLNNFGFTGNIEFAPNTGQGANQFGDFDYANSGWDTYSSFGSIGAQILYSGTNIQTNGFNPWLNSFDPTPPVSTAYTKAISNNINPWPCGSFIQGRIISHGIPPFFTNILNFGSNTANGLFIGRKAIHEFFKTQSVNTSTISGATAFMASLANSSIGNLFVIDSLVATQNTLNVSAASNLNSAFVANSIVEQNHKDFNTIYSSFMMNDSLSSNQLNSLITIAQKCPFTDGVAVYQARALLSKYDSTEYSNPCEYNGLSSHSSARGAGGSTTSEGGSANEISINSDYQALRTVIYPNPAKSEVFVETELENTTIIIYSITGQVVLTEKLKGTSSKFNIEGMSNGTYLYKLLDYNLQLIKTDKLIINK